MKEAVESDINVNLLAKIDYEQLGKVVYQRLMDLDSIRTYKIGKHELQLRECVIHGT